MKGRDGVSFILIVFAAAKGACTEKRCGSIRRQIGAMSEGCRKSRKTAASHGVGGRWCKLICCRKIVFISDVVNNNALALYLN